jgi:hypothetical protein
MDELRTKLFCAAMIQEARRFSICRKALEEGNYSVISRSKAILEVTDYYAKYGATVIEYGK